MFTYKNVPYKIFALDPKFCWAGPDHISNIFWLRHINNIIYRKRVVYTGIVV